MIAAALLAVTVTAADVDAGVAIDGHSLEIEAFEPEPPREAVDAGTVAEPIEAFSSAPAGPTARVYVRAHGWLGVDTRFDPPVDGIAENIVGLRARATLGADVKLSSSSRAVIEARALWRGAAQSRFERAKASFEPSVGDAYVDFYTRWADVRVGNQVLSFGANAAFAPADAIAPRDLRESFLQGEPEDAVLPEPAVRAQGDLAWLHWKAAYAPFFVPDRYDVFGQDEALVQPGLGVTFPSPFPIDPSVEDQLQPVLLETKRPNAFPYLGDVALEATTELWSAKVGLSWIWMTEKLPEVKVDPELAALLAASARGAPIDPAVALSVQNRLAAGESLFSGTYARQHVFSVLGSRIVGPTQLDVDVGFSPAQTFFGDSGDPLRKPVVTWVAGVSQAEDSPWTYALSYLGMAIASVHASELLALIEPPTARGAERTGWFHLLAGTLSRRLWRDDLELGVRAAFEVIQRSYAIGPRLSYKRGRVTFLLAAEIFGGPPTSAFGYYRRNDQLLAGVSFE